ncbi:zinc finger BED domain-containing protein RICESLEEPER 2-like, partial [Gastrolobium bilobum]|uniref:zinc finger BED domain-containing protein RICESLEEPER 2-like n=1 Tax=Gastrolobium bilobum TaxID=150636 RepID=UPI002AB2ECA0
MKLFFITLDNASANDNMVRNLKNRLGLQKLLLCDGQFFHVCCSAHILNHIVQGGLKVCSDALSKIRESVKYVRGSESRMKAFKKCTDQVGGINTSKGLCLDVPTRWNSTYLMLDSALIYQCVFSILEFNDRNYKYCPSLDEWDRGEKLKGFLKPFYDITELISGTSYPIANLYFLQVWQIQCSLQNTLNDDDDILKSMAERMMEKFDKYWEEYSVVLALGVLLDPRMKTCALSYCYSKVNPLTSEAKVEKIKKNAYNIFDKYAWNIPPSSNVQSQSVSEVTSASSSGSISKEKKGFSEIMLQHNQPHNAAKIGKSQLDVYLGEENLEFDDDTFDILQWWKGKAKRLLSLSLMARDLLSIHITIVAFESAFSIGPRILNKYRSSLLPECVEALLCTRNWRSGFSGT